MPTKPLTIMQRMKARRPPRPSSTARGYDHRWRKARLLFLAQNPVCVVCRATGVFKPAAVVDHIQPHNGDPMLFWDPANWQSLCVRCHNTKPGEGRFGRG